MRQYSLEMKRYTAILAANGNSNGSVQVSAADVEFFEIGAIAYISGTALPSVKVYIQAIDAAYNIYVSAIDAQNRWGASYTDMSAYTTAAGSVITVAQQDVPVSYIPVRLVDPTGPYKASGGGGSGGDASAANQIAGNNTLTAINGKTPALGQATMAASSPVVIASDQSAIPVTMAAVPTGGSTAALQTTGNTSLNSIDTKTPALGQAAMVSSVPVVIASNQSNLPVAIVAGTIGAPAGSVVTVQGAGATGTVQPIVSTSPNGQAAGIYGTYTAYGYARVSDEPTQVFGDPFDTLDTTNQWTLKTSTGTATATNSALTVASSTTASAYGGLLSIPTFRPRGLNFYALGATLQFPNSTIANTGRWFGIGNPASTPTPTLPVTDGIGFLLDASGALFGKIYANSVEVGSVTLTSSKPTDGVTARYLLVVRADLVFFYIGSTEVPVGSLSFLTPATQTLPISILSSVNASGSASSATMIVGALGLADTGKNSQSISDGAFPSRLSTVKLPSTAAVATDAPLVVALHPSSNTPAIADGTSTGTITTQNSVPAGTATAGSAILLSLNGQGAATVQVTGVYAVSALTLQATTDGATWVTVGGTPFLNVNTAALSATIAAAAVGVFQLQVAGYTQIRITALGAITGTATVTIRASQALPPATVANPTNPVTISSGTVTTVSTVTAVTTLSTLTTLANGQTAHSAASTGSPVRVGGRVNTAVDTTLVAGDASDFFVTTQGQVSTKPFGLPETDWQATAGLTPLATTTSTALKAAGAAGVRNYVTGIQIMNTSATVSTTVAILDGASVLWAGFLPATTAALQQVTITVLFATPLRGTAATAMNIQLGTTAASVYYNAQGYQAI